MLPTLRTGQCPYEKQGNLRGRLLAAPWLWPLQSDTREYANACRAAGCPNPPTPEPGRVLLVTVNDGGDSVWLLGGPDLEALVDNDAATVSRTAQAAWDGAVIAVSRSVEVLWESTGATQRARTPFVAFRLGTHRSSCGIASDPKLLDGLSFGLSFFLAIVSRLFRLPIPSDLAASAEVSESGETAPVGHIQRKIDALIDVTPQVKRILVASAQYDEAVRVARGRLTIVPITTGADAIAAAFGDGPVAQLREAVVDPNRTAAFSRRVLKLTMDGRGAVHEWSAVERAARMALDLSSAHLDADSRYSFELAAAIAARHRNNSGVVALPRQEWLDAQPRLQQAGIFATLLQHAADTAVLDAEEIERLGRAYLPDSVRDADVPHLKLAGALARLLAVTGRHVEALHLQEMAAETFHAMPHEQRNVSYPLSEWFRLAGLCGDVASFRRADRIWIDTIAESEPDGVPYVEFARARAMVGLGLAADEGRRAFQDLHTRAGVHDGVRWSAARWLVRACDKTGDGDSANAVITALRAAAPRVDAAERAVILTDLDYALAQGRSSGAWAALDRLLSHQPGVVGHLVRAAREDVPAYVAKFFPY